MIPVRVVATLLVALGVLATGALGPSDGGRPPGGAPTTGVGAFPPLGLNATATPSSGPFPLNVAFSAAASGGRPPYYYNWSFGDGSPNATVASINHTYRWAATFHAAATVVDSLGEIATVPVNLTASYPALRIGLTANPSALASGTTTFLETSVQGGVPPYRYTWTGLPIGCPAQAVENLSCTPLYGGSFVVAVLVEDAAGANATASVGLVVSGPPPPVPAGSSPPASDPTWLVVAVGAIGAVAVIAAAIIGRRARKRRGPPG